MFSKRVTLTLTNGTTEPLLFSLHEKGNEEAATSLIVLPHASSTSSIIRASASVGIALGGSGEKVESPTTPGAGVSTVVLRLDACAKWKAARTPSDSPWRVYKTKASKNHYKMLVLPRRDMASFLSEMPDSLPLSSLLLPGTHDTMAFYGWPISQCQSLETPLATQLQAGIRVLDIRLAVVDDHLVAYHGVYPQRTPFRDILAALHAFLTSPAGRREALVASFKQEDFARTPPPVFSQRVHDEIAAGPGGWALWFLENRVPALGEVRGRAVMLSRFGGDGAGWEGGLEGLGIHPTAWPDSEKAGFEWTLKGTLVRTQDWYAIPSFLSIPEKTQLAAANLLLPPADADAGTAPPGPVLNISYFSAASFPFAFPPTVARGFGWPRWGLGVEGVNARLGRWLLDRLGEGEGGGADVRVRGWAFLDYYGEPEEADVVPLLVECNFRGRKSGEEGWE